MAKMGRPTDYNDDKADEFCIRIISGRAVSSVCEDDDMPDQSTIYRWRIAHPEFREKLTHAREERAEADAKRMRDLATRVIDDASLDPMRVNAAVNAIDKAARLMAPKQRVEHTGANGGPIVVKGLTDAELEAIAATGSVRASSSS